MSARQREQCRGRKQRVSRHEDSVPHVKEPSDPKRDVFTHPHDVREGL